MRHGPSVQKERGTARKNLELPHLARGAAMQVAGWGHETRRAGGRNAGSPPELQLAVIVARLAC